MQCGHYCEEPCARIHHCACGCPQSTAIECTQDYIDTEGSSAWPIHALQRAAVEGYQAFANGGAKEQDALLSRMAPHPVALSIPARSQTLANGCDLLEDSRHLASHDRHGWVPDGDSADIEASWVQPNLLDDY